MNKKRYSAILVILLISMAGIAVAATIPTKGDAINGKEIFDAKCGIISCHGTGAEFPLSNLSKLTATDINSTVRNGVNGTTMRAFSVTELSNSNLSDVIAYIQSSTPASTMYANASIPATTATTNVSTNVTQPTPTVVSTEAVTEVVPTEIQPTEAVTEVQTPVPTPTPKSPGFEVVIGIIGIVSIYLMRRKQKR